MNTKVFFMLLSISIGTGVLFVASKYNIHYNILRAACPSRVIEEVPCPLEGNNISYINTKREMSRKLAAFYLELTNAASHKTSPTPKLLLELKEMIGDLDPAFKLSQNDREPVEAVTVNAEKSVVQDACPEKYMGEKFGYPLYEKGWELHNCSNVKPLDKVVTILLNTMDYPQPMKKQVIDFVFKGINQTYPKVQVYLAAKTRQIQQAATNYPNIKTITVSDKSSHGKVWNELVSQVTTPYTLVARDVVHFTWLTRIERQIHMISSTKHVAITGGSFRNLTGHWRVGCRQTKLFNYVLQYEEGYHYSTHSCMFCDDLEGPFVAKTGLLKSVPFSEKYSKEIVFEEFFIRVFKNGSLILNCPDVMYFTTDYSTQAKQNRKAIWQPLATDIKLVRVVLVDYGVRHKFSCGEISYKCNVKVTNYVALPMCCLEQFGDAMQLFHDIAMKNGLHYELDTGSILAAVKFNNYSPFDIDGDMILTNKNFSTVYKQADYIAQHGYKVTSYKAATFDSKGNCLTSGFLNYISPDITTEVWGIDLTTADTFAPPELKKPSLYTKCRVNNHWINCAFFPALYSRNRYGQDVLKHSQSWRHVGGKKGSFSRYHPGAFVKCNDPTFHACLDKFPGDGNIAFKVL